MKTKEPIVQILQKALKILEDFSEYKVPMGVNEIARLNGFQPSTTFRILKTLESSKWIYQQEDGKYSLGVESITSLRIISTSR